MNIVDLKTKPGTEDRGKYIMNDEELKKRSKKFAHRCAKLALSIQGNQLGNHLAGQLIRCSTSVAANYRAACLAQSKPGFIAKLSIVLEETDESAFWLEFIRDERLPREEQITPLLTEANELKTIFYASRKTASTNR